MNRCLVETVGMQTRIRARAEIERGCWCLLFVIVVTVVPAAAQVDQAHPYGSGNASRCGRLPAGAPFGHRPR
jgi:hypothetical protein